MLSLENYKSHMAARGLAEYSVDGLINDEGWECAPFRILFLLKETWGYQGCGIFNIKDHAHQWLSDNNRTYQKITTLAATVFRGLEIGRPLTDEEFDSVKSDGNIMHNALNQIAVVNVKKHSGMSQSNDPEIREESVANAHLLRDQIAGLKPHFILTGSTVCWHSLVLDQKLFDILPNCPKGMVVRHDGILLCHSNHPSAWTGGGFPVKVLHKRIIEAIG